VPALGGGLLAGPRPPPHSIGNSETFRCPLLPTFFQTPAQLEALDQLPLYRSRLASALASTNCMVHTQLAPTACVSLPVVADRNTTEHQLISADIYDPFIGGDHDAGGGDRRCRSISSQRASISLIRDTSHLISRSSQAMSPKKSTKATPNHASIELPSPWHLPASVAETGVVRQVHAQHISFPLGARGVVSPTSGNGTGPRAA
jgi:hypothetical protein